MQSWLHLRDMCGRRLFGLCILRGAKDQLAQHIPPSIICCLSYCRARGFFDIHGRDELAQDDGVWAGGDGGREVAQGNSHYTVSQYGPWWCFSRVSHCMNTQTPALSSGKPKATCAQGAFVRQVFWMQVPAPPTAPPRVAYQKWSLFYRVSDQLLVICYHHSISTAGSSGRLYPSYDG